MGDRELHAFVTAHDATTIRTEVERGLATQDDEGAALVRAIRIAELALVARLAPWRAGSAQPNVRRAVARLARGDDRDTETARLALRLAAGYARAGRVDDEALRLGRYAQARAAQGGLEPDDRAFASEAANHLERGTFLPSLEGVRELVDALDRDGLLREASSQLARRNPTFAAQLLEVSIEKALGALRLGPLSVGALEKALRAFRQSLAQGGGRAQADLAIALARAYGEGAFVDTRARDHVAAVLTYLGDRLDPELRGKLEAYLAADAFFVPDQALYEQVQALAASPLDLRLAVAEKTGKGNLAVARRLCELDLVRRFEPWRLGDPTSNVSRAIQRAARDLGRLDPDARWVAVSLAALYAATLEGNPAARALVGAVLSLEGEASDLKIALEAAGLDPGVPADELLSVYRSATDPDLPLERLRALAEGAHLSEPERAAGREVLEWLAARRGVEEGRVAEWKGRLGGLVDVVVPEAITSAATTLIEGTLRDVAHESARRVGRARILRELAKAGVDSLEAAARADLTALDRIAWSITHENRLLAALEGFGCGLGGATLVLIDLPALVTVNLNATFAIATVYGFEPEDPEVLSRALLLLAGGPEAFLQELEPEALGRLTLKRLPQGVIGGRAALALRGIALRLASRLARKKLLQLIPVVGGAIGAGLNFAVTLETTKAARMLFRLKWLQRRARNVTQAP